MSEINVTLRIDTSRIDSHMEELRLLLQRLPDRIKSDIGRDLLCALNDGRLQISFDDVSAAVAAATYTVIARWVGLDDFLAAARRAADGEVDVFHGNPSVSGFDGCGDCDSTAGRDSHPFSDNKRLR